MTIPTRLPAVRMPDQPTSDQQIRAADARAVRNLDATIFAAVTIDVVIRDGKSRDRTTGAAATTAAIANVGPRPPPLDGRIRQVALMRAGLSRAIPVMVVRPRVDPPKVDLPTLQKGQNENSTKPAHRVAGNGVVWMWPGPAAGTTLGHPATVASVDSHRSRPGPTQ